MKFRKWLPTNFIYLFSYFYGIQLGKSCVFWNYPTFFKELGGKIIIGDRCLFRSDSDSNLIGVNHKCILSVHSAEAVLRIGDNCGFSGTSIGVKESIEIGNNVLVGANSVITDFDWHSLNPYERDNASLVPSKKVVIEDNVWIGLNCVILKGVRIGRNSIIGAGSIVVKDLPENSICGGNPCKVIKVLDNKYLNDQETKMLNDDEKNSTIKI